MGNSLPPTEPELKYRCAVMGALLDYRNPVVTRISLSSGVMIHGSPSTTRNGDIIFGASDGHVYCLNALGSLKWRVPLDTARTIESCPIISQPEYSPDTYTVYIGYRTGVAAIDSSGHILWRWTHTAAIRSSPTLTR